MLEFLKAPFFALQFSYHTLVTFLIFLSVILLSMLIILLTILSVIRHLICGSNYNWLLNMNLVYKTLGWGRKWLVDFNAGKTQLVLFDWSNSTGTTDVKMDESVLEERSWGWPSLLNWIGALTWSLLLKLLSRKLEPWLILWSFYSPEVALYLCKSLICPYMEYCCHVWAGGPSCY